MNHGERMTRSYESDVTSAKNGDKSALERLVRQVQDKIYGLALRMLCDPSDAQDAAQEILIKVVTNLGSFEGHSSFSTWFYRVAVNHLLTARKKEAERGAVSFEGYAVALDTTSSYEWDEGNTDPFRNLIEDEIRIGCLQGLLLCLDRDYRVAFLLSEVFHLNSVQGSEILGIKPEAFRKRLSRARSRMSDFLLKNCSLVHPDNPCKCARYADMEIRGGRRSDELVFMGKPCRAKFDRTVLNRLSALKKLNRAREVFNTYPEFAAPEALLDNIRDLMCSDSFKSVVHPAQSER